MSARLLRFAPMRQYALFLTLLVCLHQPVADAARLNPARQADTVRPLIMGTPVSRELSGEQTHSYTVNVAAGTYLRLLITPQDMDIESSLFAGESTTDVGTAHYPRGVGERFVSLVAETSGDYRLEIRPTDKGAKAGRYEVKIVELRPATEQDSLRCAAEKAESEGRVVMFETIQAIRLGISKHEEALQLWRKLGDEKSVLRMQVYISTQYKRTGDRQKSLEYLKPAIELARKLGEHYHEANLIIGFGEIYYSLGETQKALDCFYQARQIFKNHSKKYGEALAIYDIGVLLLNLGELTNGLSYLEEALPTFETFGDVYRQTLTLHAIGKSHALLGDKQKALEFYNRTVAVARTSQSVMVEAFALGNLATAYYESGDKQKALDFFEQSLKPCKVAAESRCEGDALKKMADINHMLGDSQKALGLLNRALPLYRANWERDREAQTLISLARVNHSLGNFEEAKQQLEAALEIQEALRASLANPQLRESFFVSAQSSFALYIDVLMQLHKKDSTAGYDAAALQASEKARARSLLDLLAESRADIRQGVAKDLLEQERSLQQQINARAEVRARLLREKHTSEQAESLEKELAQLALHQQEVKTQIRQSSPRYAALTQPQPLKASEIQQQLDEKTVLLIFALGDKQSWLWAVTTSQISSFQLPARRDIESSARRVYDLLTARQPKTGESKDSYAGRVAQADAQLPDQAQALSHMLFGQIAAKMQKDWQAKRLAIVAPEALEYIPFAALPMPEEGPQKAAGKKAAAQLPLITQHEIVNLPSASALAALRRETYGRKPAEKQVAVFADPVFEISDVRLLNAAKKPATSHLTAGVRTGDSSPTLRSATAIETPSTVYAELLRSLKSFSHNRGRESFSRLPFSRQEADAIASMAPKNSLLKALDFQASRNLAANGQLSRFRIVHFATHGLLNSQHPELSGLVLSLVDENGKAQDGFLRMHEIYNLQLPADLIVLSACQTALGKEIKGEGLVGLTRGFMYAGAQRVVASLWQVDDFATAQLMKSFYRGMLKEGLRPAAALRAAQLEMLRQKPWAPPFFWAAFTIQGEWQ
jgi:CHAT domain-containing protein